MRGITNVLDTERISSKGVFIMAVKSSEDGGKLTLTIDNGDYEKLNEVMEKWRFKDYQSFLRFAISVFIVSEENSITIKRDGRQQEIGPVPELLKDKK